jgi:predicted regulator of Ras-like GTPase activity (Roadblock/LC7/MglB family)
MPAVSSSTFDLHEPEFRRIKTILSRVCRDLRADVALLTTRSGQPVMTAGEGGIDSTALASLAAANLAATDGLAKVVGEEAFPVLLHQGTRRSIFISDLMRHYSLVLVFDAAASAGLVRYKSKQTLLLLEDVLRDSRRRMEKTESSPGTLNFSFSDDELENLFGE